jgi:hypothetical protein
MPPLNLTDPVNKLDEIVESDTNKVPERFALVANVFHLKVADPKSNPLVPGTNAAVPELSLKVTRVVVPPTADPGEKEALYPVTDIAFNASPFIEIDWGLPVLSFQ